MEVFLSPAGHKFLNDTVSW